MAITSVLKLSEISEHRRIDAEYYQPDYLEIEKKVKSHSYCVLNKISYLITDGDHGNPKYNHEGIIYVTSGNVQELGVNYEKCKKISYDYSKKIGKRCYAEDNDILLTTVGKIGVATLNFKKVALSRDIARIVLSETQKLLPEFVTIYLNTIVGKKLLNRESVGSVQKGLYLVQIKNLKIPKLSPDIQKEVKNIFLKALSKFKESKSFYSQAENLLLQELGLKDLKLKHELSYTAYLSEAFRVHRLDAEYFQPVYKEIINNLKAKFKLEKLKNLSNRRKFKIKPITEQCYKYIEISDIETDIGEVTYTERLGKELPPNARIPIFGSELLVSKVRPTRKAIAIVPNDLKNNIICSSAFTVFNPPSPLREHVFISLRSIIGLLQLDQPTTGTEYPTLKDDDIENVLIPILPDGIQQEITLFIQQSHEARKKAKDLLEEAKSKVRSAIENDIKKP